MALLSDVALAQTQLTTTQAQAVDLDSSRAQLEHAIAVLTGRAPAQFTLAPIPSAQAAEVALPATPAGLPSELLEHRPDIAAAERRAAAANAQIGVARAAYFPALTLSASGGFASSTLGVLFDTPGRVWALGAALAETVFDGGLRRARDAQAVAAYDATVAQYKETVLTGFQQVEDNLATLRVLDQESVLQAQAVEAAQLAERLALTQYRAGTTSYLNVITAQALSLNNRRAAVTLRGRQVAASIGLIAATGGGWSASPTPINLPSRPPRRPEPKFRHEQDHLRRPFRMGHRGSCRRPRGRRPLGHQPFRACRRQEAGRARRRRAGRGHDGARRQGAGRADLSASASAP